MAGNRAVGESIPWMIHDLFSERDEISSGDVAKAAGVTRQAAHYHLRRLVELGELALVGAGRSSRYARRTDWSAQYGAAGLEEHLVWRELRDSIKRVQALTDPAAGVATFAFTEMLNNAIEHSNSEVVSASLIANEDLLTFRIADEGVGAFERVKRANDLEDYPAAIQEIAKGKLTTDPSKHTGQGIFFTSKAVDIFVLISNGWKWTVDNVRQDEAIAQVRPYRGTQVQFGVDPNTTRSINDVFDEYTDQETFRFDRTRTVVRLFEYDVTFVSRSEAKRLTRNLEKFEEVLVDFRGIEGVGQGFADEIFRVWQNEHPNIRLVPVNMNESIRLLVEQARARRS